MQIWENNIYILSNYYAKLYGSQIHDCGAACIYISIILQSFGGGNNSLKYFCGSTVGASAGRLKPLARRETHLQLVTPLTNICFPWTTSLSSSPSID